MPEGCLGLVSTAPFPIQFSPGHGLVCGPVNTPTRVQHSLQGRCLARAGLDNMWYIFTPLLQNEELERAPEHCDSSTMRLFPLAWKHSFHCGLQHCSGWSVLPCDFSHTPFLCLIKKKKKRQQQKIHHNAKMPSFLWDNSAGRSFVMPTFGRSVINFNVSISAGSGNVIGH